MSDELWRSLPLDVVDETLRDLESGMLRARDGAAISVVVLESVGLPLADAYRLHTGSIETLLRAIADQRVEVALERRRAAGAT